MAIYRDQPRAYSADLSELVPGALFYFFEVGTDDPKDAYAEANVKAPLIQGDPSTVTFAVPHTNPLEADESARVPTIFLDGEYRIVITDPDGNELHDLDPWTEWPGPMNPAPLSNDGEPLPFSVLTFYRSKTTMLETLAGDNPITADSAGDFGEIAITEGIAYRVLLHDEEGQLIYDVDPVIVEAPASDTLAIRRIQETDGIINMVQRSGGGAYTVCGWARLEEITGFIWTIKANDSSDTHFLALVVDGDGIELNIESSETPTFGTPDNDRWFFWAVIIHEVAGATVADGKWAYLEETVFSPAKELEDQAVSSDPVSAFELQIVQLNFSQISGGTGIGMDFTQTRQWNAALSDAELLLEKASLSAVRTADLFSDNTMQGVTDLADASGNGNSISLDQSDDFGTTDGPAND